MQIGFTGTRKKLSYHQAVGIHDFLRDLPAGNHTLHHGDCISADQTAGVWAQHYGLQVVIHPPTDPKFRGFASYGLILPKKPYLQRNHDIVDQTEMLLATPDGPETQRSGTWATVRYARKKGKPVVIILP